jgi:hypothetical protein
MHVLRIHQHIEKNSVPLKEVLMQRAGATVVRFATTRGLASWRRKAIRENLRRGLS